MLFMSAISVALKGQISRALFLRSIFKMECVRLKCKGDATQKERRNAAIRKVASMPDLFKPFDSQVTQ